ncbi:MAG: helix-turn-helix domain-containing protein [Oscillospiraceae bacterium]
MSFRDQLKARREACGLTRAALAEQLGVSASAVGNYETGVSFPKEDVLLRLFDALRTDPNQLFCGSYRSGGFDLSGAERTLLEKYRSLSPIGRSTVRSVTDALCDYRDELTEERGGKREPRLIPLYNSPAAAGYAAPVLDEDFTYIPADESVPRGADFAVRIQGDSMEPYIHDECGLRQPRPARRRRRRHLLRGRRNALQAVPPRCAGHDLPFLPQPRPRRRRRRAHLHRHAQPCLLRPRDAAAPPRGPAAVASLIFCAKNELFAREGLESFTTRAYNSNSVKSRKRKRIPP